MKTTDTNFKPTTGPWTTEKTYSECTITNLDDTIHIASAWQDKGEKEGQSNAALIADAGTVYHETGKTPSKLAEENKALIEALENLINTHTGATWQTEKIRRNAWVNAHNAIAKSKGL